MTRSQRIVQLDAVAVSLARHGWHVAWVAAADGPETLTVRGRLAGDRSFRVQLDGHALLLFGDRREGRPELGLAHDAEHLHELLRGAAYAAVPA